MIATDLLYRLSVGIVWIPLTVLLYKTHRGSREFLLFLFYFLASGLIDLIGFWLPEGDEGDRIYYPFHLVYLFLEANLILRFSIKFINFDYKLIDRLERVIFWFILTCSLLIPLVLIDLKWELFINLSSFFSGILLIIFSFLSAFGLLGLTETSAELLENPWFWFLSGMFVYSFGSFFIDLLIPAKMAYYVYFMRHIINILRGIFFIIGTVKVSTTQINVRFKENGL